LEVVVPFIEFLLPLLAMRWSWVWNIFECSPKFVALLGGVVSFQVPRALHFEQVFEAPLGLL
jgi:hypothetical protein